MNEEDSKLLNYHKPLTITETNRLAELEKKNAELEAQIEKMKCCANCKHSRTEYEHCKTNKHEKWEIKK